ncbi:Cytoskeleton protein RodZ [bacterium HR16]|nr:Cytoskeleton protein RodZ [bacterium HR16]
MKVAESIAEQLGQRIRDLRERQGLSQQELAQRAGIATSTLSEIETGRYTPNLKIVLSLAESLHVPLDTLLRVQQPPLQALLRAVETPTNVGVLQQWAERCYRYAQVEKLAGVEVTPAPAYPSPRSLEEAERISIQERERLRLGTQPVADIVQIVENNGLRVVGTELAENDVDGILLHNGTLGAFALINRSVPPARQCFTLLHEYAHYLMHREQPVHVDYHTLSSEKWQEAVANRFAAAFLMPEADILEVLKPFRLPHRKGAIPLYVWILLRRRYRVSQSALAWRLYSLGWISDQEHGWVLRNGRTLYEAEKTIFGNVEEPKPIPALTDRAVALIAHAYAREETTAAFTAETLQKPLALILDYLQIVRLPVPALMEHLRHKENASGGSAVDDRSVALD